MSSKFEMNKDYYLRHQILEIEEDLYHEFKAHRSLSDEEISPIKDQINRHGERMMKIAKRRHTLSKYIAGMVNTGKGGEMLLGVTDSGKVEGFMMTLEQRHHFLLAFNDLVQRFKPPLPRHFFEIQFVPILDEDENPSKNILLNPSLAVHKTESRCNKGAHILRSTAYCWCDLGSLAALECGLINPFFVIRLKFQRWNPLDPRNRSLINRSCPQLPPMFENEDGNVFLRMNAMTIRLSHQEIIEKTKMQIQYYNNISNIINDSSEFSNDSDYFTT